MPQAPNSNGTPVGTDEASLAASTATLCPLGSQSGRYGPQFRRGRPVHRSMTGAPCENVVMGMQRITRMDQATTEQWDQAERVALAVDRRLPDRMLQLLKMLDGMDDGFAIDQLGHALQTATRAERAGADEELIVAALMHDVGKMCGDEYHDAVSAEMLHGYVREDVYRVVRHHQDFTARYIAPIFGGDPERRSRWRSEAWFGVAETFVDEWDQLSFDPKYATESLAHFEPMIRDVFSPSD
jgi:predicted HD phosphohydrolase